MVKFRIVKRETKNGLGKVNCVNYFIEKKFLFSWRKVSIKSGYRLGKFGGGGSDMMLRKIIVKFSSEKEANEYLQKYIVGSFEEVYKKQTIIKILEEDTWEERYVNISRVTEYYGNTPCYESRRSLNELKKLIDNRIEKTTTTYVSKFFNI